MDEKSRWQQEYEALPEWAQQLVRGMAGAHGYGYGDPELRLTCGYASDVRARIEAFHILLEKDKVIEFTKGFLGMQELAKALSAPFPPPPPPTRERRAFNVVELAADEDCAFDQPCCFGHRVETHAVYCHNEAWPDSPRKCRRNRDDYKHEDCPGFVANPDAAPTPSPHT